MASTPPETRDEASQTSPHLTEDEEVTTEEEVESIHSSASDRISRLSSIRGSRPQSVQSQSSRSAPMTSSPKPSSSESKTLSPPLPPQQAPPPAPPPQSSPSPPPVSAAESISAASNASAKKSSGSSAASNPLSRGSKPSSRDSKHSLEDAMAVDEGSRRNSKDKEQFPKIKVTDATPPHAASFEKSQSATPTQRPKGGRKHKDNSDMSIESTSKISDNSLNKSKEKVPSEKDEEIDEERRAESEKHETEGKQNGEEKRGGEEGDREKEKGKYGENNEGDESEAGELMEVKREADEKGDEKGRKETRSPSGPRAAERATKPRATIRATPERSVTSSPINERDSPPRFAARVSPKSAASILTGSSAEAAAPEDANGMEALQLLEVKQKLSSVIIEKDLLRSKLTKAQREMAAKISSLNNMLDKSKEESRRLRGENEELTLANQRQQLSNEHLVRRIKTLEAALNTAQSDNDKLYYKVEETLGTVTYNTEKDRASEETFIENQQLKGKLAQLERDRTKTRDELLVTKRQFDKADQTIKDLEAALQTANTQRRLIESDLSMLRCECDFIRRDLQMAQNRNSILTQQVFGGGHASPKSSGIRGMMSPAPTTGRTPQTHFRDSPATPTFGTTTPN